MLIAAWFASEIATAVPDATFARMQIDENLPHHWK